MIDGVILELKDENGTIIKTVAKKADDAYLIPFFYYERLKNNKLIVIKEDFIKRNIKIKKIELENFKKDKIKTKYCKLYIKEVDIDAYTDRRY